MSSQEGQPVIIDQKHWVELVNSIHKGKILYEFPISSVNYILSNCV